MTPKASAKHVLLFGATGTIGRATARALLARGHKLTCFLRPGGKAPVGAAAQFGDVTDAASVSAAFDQPFDAVMSCMASRTGAPADAWAIDHQAHLTILNAARDAGVSHFVQLSAICVQKPKLAFQHAKLAFESSLVASGLTYSIVRPTAYFKSLAGQIARVQAGKPYLLFGDGRLTSCAPISDDDLGDYLADRLTDQDYWNRILPVGGPGPALTPRAMGDELFRLTGKAPKFKSLPVGVMSAIITGLSLAGRLSPKLAAKAELARIGRYYATESMLVWDDAAQAYDADATPRAGHDLLFDYYARVIAGEDSVERGDHTVF